MRAPHFYPGSLLGTGTPSTRLAGEMIKSMANVDMLNVPFKASEPEFAGFDVAVWLGLVAPAGTPPDIVNKVQQETLRILALPDVKEKLANIGLIPAGNTPAEFAAFIRVESERWAKVIMQAGIRPE